MADDLFEDPRLAAIYNKVDSNRSDLDVYAAIVEELGAQCVLDIGCGAGTFACLLAGRGIEVVGIDPAFASLEVARAKPGAERVRWLHGDATTLPPLAVDRAVMTGNVAQAFVTDDAWYDTLFGIHDALRPGGHLVFETRVPQHQAWLEWNPTDSTRTVRIDGLGPVRISSEVDDVVGQLVKFHATYDFPDGSHLSSSSTLRFQDREQIEMSLQATGFAIVQVRDAPDRPGREWVYFARRSGDATSDALAPASPRAVAAQRAPARRGYEREARRPGPRPGAAPLRPG